jgi:O-antigen ligase
MPLSGTSREQLILYVATVAAVLIHVSIAASQIFLGIGIALLLISNRKLQFPRVWLPLACLFVWTIAADALDGHPWEGRPQIRKFFVFLFLPLMFYFVRKFGEVRLVIAGWILAATLSGVWGLVQFVWKYRAAHQSGKDFYIMYLERRITGFESHWMTFGALQLSVLSLLIAHAFFSNRKFPTWVYWVSGTVLSAAIVLGWTRSIWIATLPSLLYLVWFWRPKMVLLVPVVMAAVFAVSPPTTRERLTSLIHPHGDNDSNRHRIVTFETGVQMIKAHPWFGIGPEEIGPQFNAYVPADVQRPLPPGYYGHLHNIYVQYAAERGLPALAFVLWFIGLALWDFIRAATRLRKVRSLSLAVLHGAVALTIGILVGGLFEYNLGDSEVLMMFVSVVGLGYAAVISGDSPVGEASTG